MFVISNIFGVILSGAVLQAKWRACPEQAKRAEGISRLTVPSREPPHYPLPIAVHWKLRFSTLPLS